jgi:hypothetical protein
LDEAFDEFQRAVNADKDHVALARERRDIFMDGLAGEDDVDEVIASGALARRTQLDRSTTSTRSWSTVRKIIRTGACLATRPRSLSTTVVPR